jgi:type II secretory pathway pseudopilin PulG
METRKQSGQTLVETVVAIFILTMGVSAAVGLAVYVLSSSSSVAKQIVAVGLAREGIEAVKNIRDTNWLQQTSIDTDCFNFEDSSLTAKCYRNWETQYLNIKPSSPPTGFFHLKFDSTVGTYWALVDDSTLGLGVGNWGLDYSTNIPRYGLYTYGAVPPNPGTSGYYRKITITELPDAPYNNNGLGPLLKVVSQVWWIDKKCPARQDWPGLGKCSVEMQYYMTNWKNYDP